MYARFFGMRRESRNRRNSISFEQPTRFSGSNSLRPRLHAQADGARLAKAVRLERERGDPLVEQPYLVTLRRHAPPNRFPPTRQDERALLA